MTVSRAQQICLEQTRYYHCTTRCVRRAFLCGKDRYTGKDYSHRRRWIEKRIVQLATVFAIDVLAYAIMSNHFHIVLRVADDRSRNWTDDEVIDRWGKAFQVTEEMKNAGNAHKWRDRLSSISWYMRSINEPLARWANREDECVGRFWQGRFKLQALLDDTSLLKCMAYVDLNPVRAGMSGCPLDSEFTSIRARATGNDGHLLPFRDQQRSCSPAVWVGQADYVSLISWTAHSLTKSPRSEPTAQAPPILSRLRTSRESWTREMQFYGKWYYRAVGSVEALERYRRRLGMRWLKGATRHKLTLAPT